MEQCCEVNTGLGVEVPAGEEGRGKKETYWQRIEKVFVQVVYLKGLNGEASDLKTFIFLHLTSL